MLKPKVFIVMVAISFIAACSSDPFSDSNLSNLYVKYITSGKSVAGIPRNQKVENFMYTNVLEVKNFKKTKGYDIDPTDHYVEFSCDIIYRINAADIEKKFSAEELKGIFGDRVDAFLDNIKKKDFKAGEKDKTLNLAMVLKKYDSGWDVKEVGFPNGK